MRWALYRLFHQGLRSATSIPNIIDTVLLYERVAYFQFQNWDSPPDTWNRIAQRDGEVEEGATWTWIGSVDSNGTKRRLGNTYNTIKWPHRPEEDTWSQRRDLFPHSNVSAKEARLHSQESIRSHTTVPVVGKHFFRIHGPKRMPYQYTTAGHCNPRKRFIRCGWFVQTHQYNTVHRECVRLESWNQDAMRLTVARLLVWKMRSVSTVIDNELTDRMQ